MVNEQQLSYLYAFTSTNLENKASLADILVEIVNTMKIVWIEFFNFHFFFLGKKVFELINDFLDNCWFIFPPKLLQTMPSSDRECLKSVLQRQQRHEQRRTKLTKIVCRLRTRKNNSNK